MALALALERWSVRCSMSPRPVLWNPQLTRVSSISEISTPKTRGMLMSGYQVGVQVSALIGFWASYVSHQALSDGSTQQYLIPTALQLVPGLLLILGTGRIPEAPRFLAEQSNERALVASVSWLRDLPADATAVTSEVQSLTHTANTSQRLLSLRRKSILSEAISTPSLRRRLIVGIGLMIAQNAAGLNAINYFAPSIFHSAGFTSVQSMLFLTGLFGVTKLIAAMAFMFHFVRVRGNRFWLNLGSTVCAMSMFLLAFCIWRMPASSPGSENGSGDISMEGIVSVLCVYVFSFFFGVSLGPISWNVCGEIFPARISAKCCAVTTFTQWLFQIVVASVTPRLIAGIGWGTYVVYGSCCTVALVWCWLAVPETRGVKLGREMDELFERDSDEATEDILGAEDALQDEDMMVEVSETSPLLTTSLKGRRRSSVAFVV